MASFTRMGERLGETLAARLAAEGETVEHTPFRGVSLQSGGISVAGWTAERFDTVDGLVFIGAAGIAVRAVAPLLNSKTTDPAVVSVDERGRFAVPLVSGHIGGANRLAARLAALTGGQAVISTATDVNGLFAVDEWAVRQGLRIHNPERIKAVSAKLLDGGEIGLYSDFPVAGALPPNVRWAGEKDCDVRVSYRRDGGPLCLAPPVLWVGVGCRKGVPAPVIRAAVEAVLAAEGILPEALAGAATVDRKAEEPGLLAWCAEAGLPLMVFSPERLAEVKGVFAFSAFVRDTVGVDNVCERSAALAAGDGAALVAGKTCRDGVTVALAAAPVTLLFEENL